MQAPYPSFVAAFLLLLGLAGCSSFDPLPDGPIEATGRVVLAETGESLQGLGVAIIENGAFGDTVRATDQTDADGRFTVRYTVPERGSHGTGLAFRVVVNTPRDGDYTTWRRRTNPPLTVDFETIELERSEAP